MGDEPGHIRGPSKNLQHPLTTESQLHHTPIKQSTVKSIVNSTVVHNALIIFCRPINRPRRPNRRLHSSNRRFLHRIPRHDPRNIRIRRRSRTVSPKYHPETQYLQEIVSKCGPLTRVSIIAKKGTPSSSAAKKSISISPAMNSSPKHHECNQAAEIYVSSRNIL